MTIFAEVYRLRSYQLWSILFMFTSLDMTKTLSHIKRHKKKAEITRTQNCQTSELLEMCIKFFCSLSLSCLSHSRSGDGSPLRSSPGSCIGVLGRFDSGYLAMTPSPTAPGRVLGSVTPDVLASRQHHCNVDKWRSLDVRYHADRQLMRS